VTSDSLARRLRAETSRSHRLAEATRFAQALFAGRLDVRAYALGLAHIAPVYAALEAALETDDLHPLLGAFRRPELYRSEAIEEDLARYGAETPRAGRCAYAARIDEVAARRPVALVGHFYVRYFGDLSGVARLAPLAPRLLGLPPTAELSFFRFPRVSDRAATLAELRAYLDALPLACHDEVVAEAKRSFVLHRRLVDRLFATLPRRREPRRAAAGETST
jgi:heme oxygenase (biliverdin-producing, ferredoxin)